MSRQDKEVFTMLTGDILTELVGGDVSKKSIAQIDFRDDRFKLKSLRGLELIGEANKSVRNDVTEFQLSGNQLDSLYHIATHADQPLFIKAERIFASQNVIRAMCSIPTDPHLNAWPLPMESLRELDLSHNQLTSIPDLRNMPHLTILQLSHNRIRPPWKQLRFGRNLEILNLSSNTLDWDPGEFGREVKMLKHLDRLFELYLADNPFTKKLPEYYLQCLKMLIKAQSRELKIKRIDENHVNKAIRERAENTKIKSDSRRVKKYNDPDETEIQDVEEEAEGSITTLIPSVDFLNQLLNACFQNPASCIKKVNELSGAVRSIMKRGREHRFIFQEIIAGVEESQQEAQCQLAISDMLQNMVLLMERQPQLRDPLLRALAYLAGVSERSLGQRCLEQLQNLMKSGEGMAAQIILVVEDCIIPQIRDDAAAESPLRDTLLEGLTRLATGNADLAASLSKLTPRLAALLDRSSSPQVLGLLAVVSEHPDNAEQMATLQIHRAVHSQLTKRSIDADASHSNKRTLLRIAENLARHDNPSSKRKGPRVGRSASFFILNNLHKEVIAELREHIADKSDWTPARIDDIASRIDCLDGLCQPNNKAGVQELLRPGRGYIKMLTALSQMPQAHPKILSRVYRALLTLLETPREWFPIRYPPNQDVPFMEVQAEVTDGLQFVTPLLQYLGESGSKYSRACIAAGDGAVTVGNRPLPPSQLTSQVMYDLLESAILVIRYYCNEAAMDPRNKEALDVASRLNDAGRETFLFECLDAPSDEVRLAVVNCLKVVPLDELDNNEVSHLVHMLNEVTNISAGNTEKVLGVSFELLTKLVLSNTKTGHDFRQKNAENAIQAALSILERNSARDTRFSESEDAEKFVLSQACVDYLRACSTLSNLYIFLRNREVLDRFNAILRNEDRMSDGYRASMQRLWVAQLNRKFDRARHIFRPISLERTYAGRAVEYLLQTLVGRRCLCPTGVMAPIIVRRIADVLEGIPDPGYDLVHDTIFPSGEVGEDDADPAEALSDEDDEDDDELLKKLGAGAGAGSGAVGARNNDFEADGGMAEDEDRRLAADANARRMVSDASDADVFGFPEQRERVLQSLREAVQFWGDDTARGAQEVLTREEAREREMPAWWEYDVSVPGRVGGVRRETAAELADRIQQHHIFSTSHGLERLIMFIAMDEYEIDDTTAERGGRTREDADKGSIQASTFIERLDEFIVVNQQKEREAEAARARKEKAAEMKAGEEGRLATEKRATGGELLLQAFMTADEDALAVDEEDTGRVAATDTTVEHERAAVVAASLRVILALLRHGSPDTRRGSLNVLRQPEVLRTLAYVCNSSNDRPMWFEHNIGSKFLVIIEEILRTDVTVMTCETGFLPLMDFGMQAVKRMLSTVHDRLQRRGTLAPDEERVVVHVGRVAVMAARQLARLRLPSSLRPSVREGAIRFAFAQIMPQPVVEHIVGMILFNLRADDDFAALRILAEDPLSRMLSLPTLLDSRDLARRDNARDQLSRALIELLASEPSRRFDTLELFAREEVINETRVRHSFLQEMLSGLRRRIFQDELEVYMREKGMFPEPTGEEFTGDRDGLRERIIDHAWAETIGAHGSGKRIIVVTTGALYIMAASTGGGFFGGGGSVSEESSLADVSPSVSHRIEYRSVTRIVLGFGGKLPGQRVHFSTAESADPTSPPPHTTCTFPRLGTAERIYTTIMAAARARLEAEGADLSILPPIESDTVLEAVVEAHVEERSKDPEEAVLVTMVDLLSGLTRQRKVLVLTDSRVFVCGDNIAKWSMPIDWPQIERIEASKFEERRAQSGVKAESREERTQREAKEAQEFQEAVETRAVLRVNMEADQLGLLEVEDEAMLEELLEMACDPGTTPGATIRFGMRKKQEGTVDVTKTWTVLYPDDFSRRLWLRAANVARLRNGEDVGDLDKPLEVAEEEEGKGLFGGFLGM